jgi:hypothetical protein
MNNFTRLQERKIDYLTKRIKDLKNEKNELIKITKELQARTPSQSELRREALFNCFEDLRNACDGYTDFSDKTNEEIKKETLKNIDYFLGLIKTNAPKRKTI